jgi:hypothetical protein
MRQQPARADPLVTAPGHDPLLSVVADESVVVRELRFASERGHPGPLHQHHVMGAAGLGRRAAGE